MNPFVIGLIVVGLLLVGYFAGILTEQAHAASCCEERRPVKGWFGEFIVLKRADYRRLLERAATEARRRVL